jgi:ribosome biogenesis GTPase A
MAKATNEIKKLKNVDLVIEVVDARCINISSNPELIGIFNTVPKLKVAIKSDLADIDQNNNFDIVYGSIKQKQFKRIVIDKIGEKLKSNKDKLINKGLKNPHFIILVVGLPNIGKSSLINLLCNRNRQEVQNKPGITKGVKLININQNLSIYDTAGILIKNITNLEDGYKLALVGTIKKTVLPINDVCEFAFNFLMQHYKTQFQKHYQINYDLNFSEFLSFLCEKFKFKIINNQNNFDKALLFFYDNIINGKITKINYEK